MKIYLLSLIAFLPVIDTAHPLASEPPMAPAMDETTMARQWTAAKFQGRELPKADRRAELVVVENHDPVQLNSRNGKPLAISGRSFTRGLYCHAPSKVVVRLPGPGGKFQALAGVDSNQDTSGGRGSVVFSVGAGGKRIWDSGLMREGMAAKSVEIDLDGALEFTLEVGDGGDGIACDQADWADACVTLKDGNVLWLGSLPMAGEVEHPLTTEPPFSFTYGGKRSSDFLKNWKVTRTEKELDAVRREHTTVYSDPESGLTVRCAGVAYNDFPTVEWTLFFSNAGTSDSALIENILPLDESFERNRTGEFTLHHFRGTTVAASDLEPLQTVLQPSSSLKLASVDGRPCSGTFPYFNIHSARAGWIVAVGWPGQWSANLVRNESIGLHVSAGQQLTHFKLHPGEEVRTPMIVLQFYSGDWIRSQNIWRRWMTAHNVPRPGGELPKPVFTPCSSHQYAEMTKADEASQKMFIDRYIEEGLKPDYWWMDAGWYQCDGNWPKTGTWEVDDKRFPKGLRAVSDHAHSKGVKTIVWFEPERVAQGTWLANSHPEWLLKSSPNQPAGQDRLLNLGNPEAFQWLVDHIDGIIKSQGIDLYRQDYNIGPLAFWRGNDADDRQGITEIKYVTGYLAYWDELRRRNPNLLIDSCASGGHRNDLETMRRAVPLLRSDYIFEPIGQQCHTYGHAFWLPFFGTGNGALDVYTMRSAMCNNIIGCWDLRRKDLNYDLLRRVMAQWREVSQDYYGDYYPLTPYSLVADAWIAWQFNRPEAGRGVVQAYRRQDSFYESARLKLFGLDAAKTYSIRNLDTTAVEHVTGKELMEKGLLVSMPEKPASAWITYSQE